MLAVVDKTSKPLKSFQDLEISEVFYDSEGMLCIKTSENTVIKYFDSDEMWCSDYIANRYDTVAAVNATLTLED